MPSLPISTNPLLGNTLGTARDLNSTLSTQMLNGSVDYQHNNDYYRMKLASRSTISLTLDGLSADANLSIIQDRNNNKVFDAGELVASSSKVGLAAESIAATLDAGEYYVRVWQSTGKTTYNLRVNTTPLLASTNDFDGDGRADILWRNGASGDNVIWQMNGNTHVGDMGVDRVGDTNWKIVGTADFDKDGRNDILWRNSASGENVIWRMNGGTHIGDLNVDKVADLNWQIVGTADFDNDGRADILWRNSATGENLVWRMNGGTHVGDIKIDSVTDPNWRIVGLADFDGDKHPDLLWRNSATGENLVWRMNGGTHVGDLAIERVSDLSWQVASTADFDGDKRADIFWRNAATGENLVWRMNGNIHIGDLGIPVTDTSWKSVGAGSDNAAAPINQFRAEYFNNKALTGQPVFTRIESAINNDWGMGGPGNRIGNDNFSVRWTGKFSFEGGDYLFSNSVDDGMRLWVDGNLIHDTWSSRNAVSYSKAVSLSAGQHEIKVEYREDGGLAFAKVSWQKATVINQIKILYPSNQTPGVSSPIIQPLPEVISIPPSNGTRSTYTIQPGDTLTQVAQRYLGDANRWREITKDNGQSFTDDEARRLQAGQVIYFAGSGGSNNNSGNSGSTSSVGSYNRQAAVNYAQQYSNTKNPRYQYYTDANCANFVSQCLVQAGELPEKANSAGDQPFEYINANGLKNYLMNQGLAKAVGSINELKAGDVIAYSWDGGPIMDHVAIYLGNGQVASNTTNGIWDWKMGIGTIYPSGKYVLVHITDGDSNPGGNLFTGGGALVAHNGNSPGQVLKTVNTAWGTKNIGIGAVDAGQKVNAVLAAIRAFEAGGNYGSFGGSVVGDYRAGESLGAYQETNAAYYLPIGNSIMGTSKSLGEFTLGNPLAQDIAAIGRLADFGILETIRNANLFDEGQRLNLANNIVNAWGSVYSDADHINSTQQQKDNYKLAHSQAILEALNV